MVHRGVTLRKTIAPRASEADAGPSPFPLLVMVVIITAIFLLRPRQENFGLTAALPSQSPAAARVALP
jgi:hypothetical protein